MTDAHIEKTMYSQGELSTIATRIMWAGFLTTALKELCVFESETIRRYNQTEGSYMTDMQRNPHDILVEAYKKLEKEKKELLLILERTLDEKDIKVYADILRVLNRELEKGGGSYE